MDTARRTTVDEFELFCHHVRARIDTDGPPDPNAEPSRVYLSKLFDGRYALSGDLSADDGAILATILADTMARLRATARHKPDAPDGEAKPVSQWKAEAFMRLALDGAGATRPGHVALFLHIDLADLDADVPYTAHTEANLDITDQTLWGLLAGGDVTPVFNTNGTPLCYGRTRRLAPPILRRGLAHRDRCCRFAWCDSPAVWDQSHHVVFFEHGGPSDPANFALMCSFHHHLIHDQRWRLDGTPPDVTVIRPDGTPHVVDQHWRTPQRLKQQAERDAVIARLNHDRRQLRSA